MEWVLYALLVLLIVIVELCRNALNEIKRVIKTPGVTLEDREGDLVNVASELRSIHHYLRDRCGNTASGRCYWISTIHRRLSASSRIHY